MEIRFTDADGFDRQAQGADMAIVLISRQDIVSFRVGSVVERLMLFSDSREQAQRFAGRMVLQVEGYDDDPRPLVLIPEVVRFFRAVDAQWNHWLHFLMPEEVEQIRLILLMLVDVKEVASQHGSVGYALLKPDQLDDVIKRLVFAMQKLHEAFDIPLSHAEVMIAAVMRAVG